MKLRDSTRSSPQLPPDVSPAVRSPSLKPQLQRNNCRKKAPRRSKNPNFERSRKSGAPAGKRGRAETPLLKWKVEEKRGSGSEDKLVKKNGDGHRRKREKAPSARMLGAVLWRLQLPAGGGLRRSGEGLGFKSQAGPMGLQFLCHHGGKAHGYESNDLLQSPKSVNGGNNEVFCKIEPPLQFSSTVAEGATKWDPICSRSQDKVCQIYGHLKLIDQQASAMSVISVLEVELEQARSRIQELEIEHHSSKKKLEHFLKKVSEERLAWRNREHEKVRMFINDLKNDIKQERKNSQKLEIVNSKLVRELADVKLTAKRFMQDYEKERKTRELTEEVCDELAKEVADGKAEVEEFKRESMKFCEEVEEERKMLQMAEVWREERIQMKLVDAKFALEEKHSEIKTLVAELETFMNLRSAALDVKELEEAELLQQAAASVNIQDIKEFTYGPSDSDDIFRLFEVANFGDTTEREIDQCRACSTCSHASKTCSASPEVKMTKDGIQRHSSPFSDCKSDMEDDESEWETVSHLEDQGSSCLPKGSAVSFNKDRQHSNASVSGTEWEDNVGQGTPISEISEICSVPSWQLKKPSITRLWKSLSNRRENYKVISVEGSRVSNGRISNASTVSLDKESCNGGSSPLDITEKSSSPESDTTHVGRGRKGGCIEWPRGMQKSNLKTKVLDARMESEKVQLRQVLEQKM